MVNYTYENALHNAALKCDVEALRRCLTPEALAACPIDTRDRDNHAVLHALCRYEAPWRDGKSRPSRVDDRNTEDVEVCLHLLVDAGADLEARDIIGCTPLQVVAWYSNYNLGTEATLRLTSLLLRHGANVNAKNDRDLGSTLLHTAASFAHSSMVSLLLKAGAAVNALTRDFRASHSLSETPATPLDKAAGYGRRTNLPILLRAGAVLNRYQLKHPDLARSSSGAYLAKVDAGGGFKKYEQAHLAKLTNTFEPKFTMLPKELVRHVVSFWLHAGYY